MKNPAYTNIRAPKRTTSLSHMIGALAIILPAISLAETGGYLIATSKDQIPEKIQFCISEDGHAWKALNQAKPILTSEVGENGVFYPSLLRMEGGNKFILLATDMSLITRKNDGKNAPGEAIADAAKNGSRSIVIWESPDLIHWENARLVEVAPPDAGCAWAPQAIYDPETKDYLVFWSSTIKSDKVSSHRIWASRTKDFKTFTPAELYLQGKGGVTGLNIVKEDNRFYRFYKDVARNQIVMESSQNLGGPWDEIMDFSLAHLKGIDSPECFALPPNGKDKPWCLFLNSYMDNQYGVNGFNPFIAKDLSRGDFVEAKDFAFPYTFRSGGVLPISQAELSKLQNEFGNK